MSISLSAWCRLRCVLVTLAPLALAAAAFVPAAAQEMVSREVVQPLPSAEVQRLNRALVELAKNPLDLDALIEAGTAASGVEDLEAAAGFFARAAAIDPAHPKVAMGLGGVYLRQGRASEALVQFDQALAAGEPEIAVLNDQALALDLVGEHLRAQAAYTRVLTLDPGLDEARRRLAISHAIAGNQARFEETLRPLLDQRDMAAQRARAFGLAILGEQDRAAAIVEQVMPRDLSGRIVPYLAYMPRLTRPQQAAAANLGIFPRAADIGRDDPRLARFADEARADSRLAPAGAPLDARPQPLAAPVPAPTPVTVTAAAPAFMPVAAPAVAPSADSVAAPAPDPAPDPTPVAAAEAVPAQVSAPLPVSAPVPMPAPAAPSAPERVADAFADLTAGALPDAQVGGGAVDLTRITIPREAATPPPAPRAKPEPPKPSNPSRVWVQVATGRDLDALAFDWRRIARGGGPALAALKPHTARWGTTHRLLAGPLDSRDKAQALVRELKTKGIDTFLYVSPEGEEIQIVK
jgi:tetratricopeptide (TPR) repeat protein